MITHFERKDPIKTTLITVFFPGYYFWTDDRQIEAISLTIAVYMGYLILLGVFIEIYLLYYTWKKISKFNREHGFQTLTEQDKRVVTVFGVFGGVLGHPFFLLLSYYWFVTLDLGTHLSPGLFQVDRSSFLFALILLFMLRFLLYYSIRQIRLEDPSNKIYSEFKRFARNNSSAIVAVPTIAIIMFPPSSEIFSIYLFTVLLPLSVIFGLRILYNNLLDFR